MELSESLEKRRKQQRNYLIFLTLIIIIAILIEGVCYFVYHIKEALGYLIGLIILFILLSIIEWTLFYYQKKKDESSSNKERNKIRDKIARRINIAEGITMRYYAMGYSIAAIIFLLGGIYVTIAYRDFRSLLGVLFIIISIALVYVIITYWKWSKIKLKGRYY